MPSHTNTLNPTTTNNDELELQTNTTNVSHTHSINLKRDTFTAFNECADIQTTDESNDTIDPNQHTISTINTIIDCTSNEHNSPSSSTSTSHRNVNGTQNVRHTLFMKM